MWIVPQLNIGEQLHFIMVRSNVLFNLDIIFENLNTWKDSRSWFRTQEKFLGTHKYSNNTL